MRLSSCCVPMKLFAGVLLISSIVLTGCAAQPDPQAGPTSKLTAKQSAQKIANDPKIPDGLKKIQMNTLQHEPGYKP